MANESPAFRFYPRDFIADTLHMTAEEIGGYLLLLCVAWHADRPGYIPNDEELLAKNARMTSKAWARCRKAILGCLKVTDDGAWVYSKRMDAERQKQIAFSSQKSDAGKKGAAKKWETHETEMAVPSVCHAPAIGLPMAKNSFPFASASSLSDSEETLVSPSAPLVLVLPAQPSEKFDFASVYDAFPRKKGKTKGIARLKATVRTPEAFEQLQRAVKHAVAMYAAEGTELQFVPHFSSWVGTWQDFINPPQVTPKALERRGQQEQSRPKPPPFRKPVVVGGDS